MTTLTCTLASRTRDRQFLRKGMSGDEVGHGLREAISATQVRIDSAFAHSNKMVAKLRENVAVD